MEELAIVTGKRKGAAATARFYPGNGKITVNKKPIKEYLKIDRLVYEARKPIERVNMHNKFDIHVIVRGGGISGQAEAILHSIAKGLVEINPEFKKPLKDAGYLKRDARIKERKKYGLRKARRGFQHSKR
ncbi:30S ribosomal protein S9 [candidate division WOR-3 bacterium]|nr:30S ribosomal protein S9 [candidate division WOR-3 bacterium]MCK4527384.1 30S ribosomal protein S9 [candidate division WOR-3 bacterium]